MSLEEKLLFEGFENVVIFKDYDYEDAFLGVTNDNRAVYDYDLMVESLMQKQSMTIDEAIEWIDYNTIGAIGGKETDPLILFKVH